jgi:hypothetical protein
MNLGTGIFLSSVFLGLVWLFLGTKDRWNWPRIVKVLAAFAVVAVLAAASISHVRYREEAEQYRKDRNTQKSFCGLRIGQSKNDVKSIKGAPSEEAEDQWLYSVPDLGYRLGGYSVVVSFKEGKVSSIQAITEDEGFYGSLFGITMWQSMDSVVETHGDDYEESFSEDGLQKAIYYKDLGALYQFREGAVRSMTWKREP